MPSAAVRSCFDWLQREMPKFSIGQAVLVHGDYGFHNFLMDGTKLSAVIDWEHAHIGHPAEDIAYLQNVLSDDVDWSKFLQLYADAGGAVPTSKELHYFRIWGHCRNLCSANMAVSRLIDGSVSDLNLLMLPYSYMPKFFQSAAELIRQSGGG